MKARSIAQINSIDCLRLEAFAHKPSVITEEIRINYISVVTGVTKRLDLSTLFKDFLLTNIVLEQTREDRVLDVKLTNRTNSLSQRIQFNRSE